MRRLLLLLALLGSSPEAWAFCRSTTCVPKKSTACSPDEDGCRTEGLPLFWKTGCVGFSLHELGSNNIEWSEIERTFNAALLAWSSVSCGDRSPSFTFGRQADALCAIGYDRSGPNANVVIFHDNGWPYQNTQNTLGYTTVTFVPATGEILNADIEINTAQNFITTGDSVVRYDLQSILTHELGHALGLSHSSAPSATMRARYDEGSTDMRSLSPDDRDALCFTYPPSREATCDLTPKGGFTTCRSPQAQPQAPSLPSCAASSLPSSGALPFSLAALGLSLLRRRRAPRP